MTNLQAELANWFEQNKRILPWRETTDPYCIWISEIILQQTRVNQGIDYYIRFIQRFPDIASLASASEDEVLLYWQGLGYYSRARNLHTAAKQIVEYSLSKHIPISFPTEYTEIRSLKGIGDYTAGAISSFAYNLPYPALDGNVYRVLSRLFDCDIPFDTSAGKKHFYKLAEQLLDSKNPRLHNSAIMEFGALYCLPQNPPCEQCCIRQFCMAFANHTQNLLPIRKEKKKLRDRYLNYIVLQSGEDILIHQRTQKDIWQHLYEFILIESDHIFSSKEVLTSNQLTDVSSKPLTLLNQSKQFTHILSHQRLHARFFHVATPEFLALSPLETNVDYHRIPIEDLENYALSRLTLIGIELLRLR